MSDTGERVISNMEMEERVPVEWVEVEVNASLLPDVLFTEDVLVRERSRSCISYTARNVRMIEARPNERDRDAGRVVGANELLIYVSQKTSGQSVVPVRFRIARVTIYYKAPVRRRPSGSLSSWKSLSS